MDIFEKFNAKFGKWYEGLFGGDAGELRPKDVLRKIIAAMEDNRKEGLDSKIYVPNKYVLELAVADAEERDYLLSFLDADELTQVLQKFMAQNKYHTRGPLDFTIADVPEAEREGRREKLRVKVKFEKGETSVGSAPSPASPTLPRFAGEGGERLFQAPAESLLPSPAKRGRVGEAGEGADTDANAPGLDDLPTIAVARFHEDDEPGTVPAVAWGGLAVTGPDGRRQHVSLTRPVLTIGRSRNAGNDLVLDSDGMVSKTHARLAREGDGTWTLSDLGSTNGVKIGGARIEGAYILRDGDEITIGETKLVFQQAAGEDAAAPVPSSAAARRPRLVDARGVEHVLASETLVGRGVTGDIVLDDPSVSTRHARLIAPDPQTCYVEDLGSEQGTRLNGRPVSPGQRALLADGDRLAFGQAELRFVGGAR